MFRGDKNLAILPDYTAGGVYVMYSQRMHKLALHMLHICIFKRGLDMGIEVGIIGAGGYAGIELVHLLLGHPTFTLTAIADNTLTGQRLDEAFPAFVGQSDLTFTHRDDPILDTCDMVFLAVPHTASLAITPHFIASGVTVIDLSADYRLRDPKVYEQWYGVPHTSPDLLGQAAFGLPEITGDQLAAAAEKHAAGNSVLVACAGCYPTATSLSAYPAVSQGLAIGDVFVQAISGVTGAGKKPTARTHFCNADENVEAYGVKGHRHTPEIEQILNLPGHVVFIPHLAPLKRGLLSTVTIKLAHPVELDEVYALYTKFYSQSPFVHVLPQGVQPKTSSVVGTNNAHIGLELIRRSGVLVATCVIDNLTKGAAGQAVQCANIVCGLSQDEGLSQQAVPV